MSQHRSRTMDQQGAKIPIAALAYAQQPYFSSTAGLAWHKPDLGCEFTARPERLRIAHRSYRGGRGQ